MHLKVAVELFYLDENLMYQNPVGFLQRVGDVVLEGLMDILSEHLLMVRHDTLTEGVPSLGGSWCE